MTIRSNRIEHSQGSPVIWLGYLCILLLLTVTTLQVTHLCGAQIGSVSANQSDGIQEQSSSPSGTLCAICLMAQPVVAAMLLITFTLSLRRRIRARAPQTLPRIFFNSFQLYVRPPPVY